MVQNKDNKMEKLIEKIKKHLESLMSFKKNEETIAVTKDEIPSSIEMRFGEDLESQIQAYSLSGTEENIPESVEQNENINTDFGTTDIDDIQSMTDVEKSISKESIEHFPQEVEEKIPLLENEAFIKLVEECVDMMNEFDGYKSRLESDESKMIVELIVKRIQEFLERAGLQRIDDMNEPFSVLRHTPVPMIPVKEGEPIRKILQAGLILDNRVLVKAKVEI